MAQAWTMTIFQEFRKFSYKKLGQHGFIQELRNLYQEFQQFLRKLFCKEFGQQLFQKLRQQLFERWKFQKLRRRLLRRRLQKFGREFRRQQTQVASV